MDRHRKKDRKGRKIRLKYFTSEGWLLMIIVHIVILKIRT